MEAPNLNEHNEYSLVIIIIIIIIIVIGSREGLGVGSWGLKLGRDFFLCVGKWRAAIEAAVSRPSIYNRHHTDEKRVD